MERIAKLLFATTALWIFTVALIFAFVDASGNGGEYWGFDGRITPRRAAEQSYDNGENRFLAYDLDTAFSGTKRGFPNVYRCDFHPKTEYGHVRFSQIAAKHGYDSVRKAEEFARRFNYSLAALLSRTQEHWCEPVVQD